MPHSISTTATIISEVSDEIDCAMQYINHFATPNSNLTSLNFNNNPNLNIIQCSNSTALSSFSIRNNHNNSIYQSLGYLLGFRKTKYEDVTNLISESIIDLNCDNYLFLKVNDYGQIYHPVNINKNNENLLQLNSYLGKIIIPGDKKNQNVFDNKNFITKKFVFRQPVNISKFDIELLDSTNNTVNMLLDFSMTIEIGTTYLNEISS
jgi:hypothetical protein